MSSIESNNQACPRPDGGQDKARAQRRLFLIIFCVFVMDALFLVGLFVGWVLLTPSGGGWLVRTAVEGALDPEVFEMGPVQGSLSAAFDMTDIVFADQKILPADSRLVIKRLRLDGDLLNWRGSQLHLEQGRLFLPSSDPILFEAELNNGVWEAFLYGRRVDLEDLLNWPVVSSEQQTPATADVRGTLNDLDVTVKGPWEEVVLEFNATLQRLVSETPPMSIEEAPVQGRCVFVLETPLRIKQTQCRMTISKGRLKVRHLSFDVMPSRIHYNSVTQMMDLSIQLRTVAAGHNIVVTVTGSPDHPQLGLSSDPPQSRAQILSLLALGGTLEGSDNEGEGRRLALDISRLFLLGPRGAALFKKLGLSSATVSWSQNERGVQLEKRVGSRVELKYGLKQQNPGTSSQTTQTRSSQEVGAEVDVGQGVAVEIKQRRPLLIEDTQKDNERTEGEVLLKFKKSF